MDNEPWASIKYPRIQAYDAFRNIYALQIRAIIKCGSFDNHNTFRYDKIFETSTSKERLFADSSDRFGQNDLANLYTTRERSRLNMRNSIRNKDTAN